MGADGLEFHETQSPDSLERGITSAQAAACWSLRQMLIRIAAYDREQHWKVDGAQDMVAWLVRAEGLSNSTARDYVHIAHRLQDLPQIAKTFEAGLLSFDQVRALCRFATPDTDADLAEAAQGLSVAELHRLARTHEPVTAAEDVDVHARRSLKFWTEYRDRMTHFSGALPPEAAAIFKAAVAQHADRAPKNPETGDWDPFEARAADAIADFAAAYAAKHCDPRKPALVVHADETTLATDDGDARIEAGPHISAAAARRAGCDGYIQIAIDTPDGPSRLVGERSRAIPAKTEREVRDRDDGRCRFPGCGRTLWVEVHHIVHWARGGPSTASNLVCICSHHHRFVHEHQWSIEGDPNHQLTYRKPNGKTIRAGPDP